MEISNLNTPKHVAIIMDGNGRWAKKKGETRLFGHNEGVNTVQKIIKAAIKAKIKFLTLYTFSKENWDRPKIEISNILSLLTDNILKSEKEIIKNKIKINTIGHIEDLPKKSQYLIQKLIKKTNKNKDLTLTLAISYSARTEIIDCIQKILEDQKNGKFNCEKLNEESVNNYLYTKNIPYPDLLIRTGGEKRISNFLLWQLAYTELYFSNTEWPDFCESEFNKAIEEFQRRERRFGKVVK
ncbi:MAG: di-trans,poly-cis-decaprenylcistransferase [Flavobacteriales bacterium]|nr:di-trans,poly-cis-decaprenylcistransferase [Flavobacteriales bacterium]